MRRTTSWALLVVSLGLPIVGFACGRTSNQTSFDTCNGSGTLSISPAAYPAPSASTYVINGATNGSWCGVQSVTVLQAFSASPASSSAAGPDYAFWSAQVPLGALEALPPCGDAAGNSGVQVTAQATMYNAPAAPGGGGEGGEAGEAPQAGDAAAPTLTTSSTQCVQFTRTLGSGTCETPLMTDALPNGTQVLRMPLAPGPGMVLSAFAQDVSLAGRPITWKSVTGVVSPIPSSPFTALLDAGAASSAEAGIGEAGTGATGANCASYEVGASALAMPTATGGLDTVLASIDGFGSPVASWNLAVQGPAKVNIVPATLTPGGTVLIIIQNPMGFSQTCSFTLTGGAVFNDFSVDAGGASGSTSTAPDDGGVLTVSAVLSAQAQTFAVTLPPSTVAVAPASVVVECVDEFSQVGTATVPPTSIPDASTDDGSATDGSSGGADGAADGGAGG